MSASYSEVEVMMKLSGACSPELPHEMPVNQSAHHTEVHPQTFNDAPTAVEARHLMLPSSIELPCRTEQEFVSLFPVTSSFSMNSKALNGLTNRSIPALAIHYT